MSQQSWDYDNMEKIKDECLPFIRMLFIDLYLHRYTKACTIIFLGFHVPLWATQFYFFLKTFDGYFIAQYAPCFLIFFYVFTAMLIPIAYEKYIRELSNKLNKSFWPLRAATSELKYVLQKQAAFAEIIAKVNVILAMISYICLLMRAAAGKEWEILYQVTFIKKYFPEYAPVLVIIFYISLAYIVIPMLLVAYVLVYFILHAYFQAKMLNERIFNISENYSRDINLAYDDDYQNQVHNRLRFCVIHICKIKTYAKSAIDLLPPLVVTYFLLGAAVIICYATTWYLDPDKYYPLFFMVSIASGYTIIIIVEIGQLIEEESMVTLNALNFLPWYTFRVKTQKNLLFVCVHSSIPVVLSPYETFPVNRRLIVQFYKFLSSACALLANSRKKIFN